MSAHELKNDIGLFMDGSKLFFKEGLQSEQRL